MNPGSELAITHVIQQAVAPVFLLTGVGAILGVLTNRLSRIIDRIRNLDDGEGDGAAHRQGHLLREAEMRQLVRRRVWIHRAITLCTIGALLVCVVIAVLFMATEAGFDPSRVVAALFVTAMLSLICGLLCFLREIAMATSRLDGQRH